MTLFDVIRFPIGRPPTLAQLDALPTEVYMKWVKEIGFVTQVPARKFIAGILQIPVNDPNPSEDECYDILIRLLEEYNSDDSI